MKAAQQVREAAKELGGDTHATDPEALQTKKPPKVTPRTYPGP